MTIFDNTTGSVNGGFGATETTWLAGKICVGSQAYTLDSLSLLLNSQDFSGAAGPPSNVRLQIYSHDALHDKPLASTAVIMNLISHTNPVALLNGQELVKWSPVTPFQLEPNTCYWAVLSGEGGANIGEIASATPPTGAIATLGASRSADGGTTWQVTDPGYNFKMLIQGKPAVTPPPPELTIFDNSKGTETGLLPLNATTWVAGKFCLRSQPYQLGSVSLLLTGGSPGGETVRLGIYANEVLKGVPSMGIRALMNLTGLTNPITDRHSLGQVEPRHAVAPFSEQLLLGRAEPR